ncbi:MAG TPA: long-chain-fatty-acid--CoA ligase [Mycobacteriales bacterium]|nr:long-chain-fatty-acid--CoA ligase [Mycobacteriales bacterium]
MTREPAPLKGLMGGQALTVHAIFDRMRTVHADGEVVDATGRTTYGELAQRILRTVTVLRDLGVSPGDRVATFANNSADHLVLYYAVPLAGAVLHMVNIRLYPEQIDYVVDHAGDILLIADDDLLDQVGTLVERAPALQRVLTMTELSLLAGSARPAEALTAVDEDDPCGICYTSGTTGMPKGVVYTHRATYLHAMAACMVDHLGISQRERILPVVPLFHACGWGLPYAAPFTGAELVFAGADTSPANLARIIESERVTWAAGVPTIWTQLLPLVEAGAFDFSSLRTLGVGGAATPRPLMEAYDRAGIEILQIWGMTETTPLACTSRPRRRHAGLDADALRDVRLRTGTIFAGLEARITSEDGAVLPWDGVTVGELECRGPWVATAYYDDPALGEKFRDGWLRTGDMAVMEPDGYFRIVDRSKDLVKSGGEWISSLELEAAIMAHPQVREAAVVAVRSRRWDERPVAVVVPVNGTAPSLEELRDFLTGRVAKWWLPDQVVVLDEVPKTSVGKFDKKAIRDQLSYLELP